MPKRKSNISQAFVNRNITLNSRFSQNAYTRIYESVSGSLYLLGIVLRIIGTEDDAQSVEEITDNMINNVETDLRNERDRLVVVMENNGIDDMRASYTSPITIDVQITSPRASRFLNMVELLDEISCRLDCLWLSNLISDQQYSNAGYMWQRRVVRLANRIRINTTRAIKSAKTKGEETARAVHEAVKESGVSLDDTHVDESDSDDSDDADKETQKAASKKKKAA